MWLKRLSLQTGGASATFLCENSTLVGNLWEFLGSPPGILDVVFVVDSCDAGNIIVTNDFAPGSTFQFTCINAGRIIGLGGNGGNGGNDSALGFSNGGQFGGKGGTALKADAGILCNVDIDDGFLMGGGGGGGGGSYQRTSPTPTTLPIRGDPGCGGGGGAGFSTTSGGEPGLNTIDGPEGRPGKDGGPDGGADGGVNRGLAEETDGGNGGEWGGGGDTGMTSNFSSFPGTGFNFARSRGGIGGRGGRAFDPNGGAIAFNGATGVNTLRSQERLRGEITEIVASLNGGNWTILRVIDEATSTVGVNFHRSGAMTLTSSPGSNSNKPNQWATDDSQADFGDDYEVRIRKRGNSEDKFQIDNEASPQGTFVALTSNKLWNGAIGQPDEGGALYQIRLASAPEGDWIQSYYISTQNEDQGN